MEIISLDTKRKLYLGSLYDRLEAGKGITESDLVAHFNQLKKEKSSSFSFDEFISLCELKYKPSSRPKPKQIEKEEENDDKEDLDIRDIIQEGSLTNLRKYIQTYDNIDNSDLQYAISTGNIQIVKEILNNSSVEPNEEDTTVAIKSGNVMILHEVMKTSSMNLFHLFLSYQRNDPIMVKGVLPYFDAYELSLEDVVKHSDNVDVLKEVLNKGVVYNEKALEMALSKNKLEMINELSNIKNQKRKEEIKGNVEFPFNPSLGS